MKFSIKNRIAISNTAVVAILMCLVCMFVFCMSTALNAKQSQLSAVERHIVLTNEIDADSVLSKYDDATFTIEGTTGVFDGYQNLDPSIFSEIDNISVDSLTDEENKTVECRVHYTYTYDVETNIVTIRAEMHNEYGEIEIDNLQGVAFTDDNGNIDAILTLDDGETVLLSDLMDSSVIDNVGWLSRLFKVAVGAVVGLAVGIAVAVVATVSVGTLAAVITTVGIVKAADSVESVNRNVNYWINIKQEQPDGYINNQKDYAKWHFGAWTLNENGCGVIAVYNAMLKLGKPQKLYNIICEIEKDSGTIALGAFGTDPSHFRKYFNKYGVPHKSYFDADSFENALKNMSNSQCAVLCYKNNINNIRDGFHNVMIAKEKNGGYEVYNLYGTKKRESPNIINNLSGLLIRETENGVRNREVKIGLILG